MKLGTGIAQSEHEEEEEEEEEEEKETEKEQSEEPPDYQPCTFRPGSSNSAQRRTLLPAYPYSIHDTRPSLLLLTNELDVDRRELEFQSYCGGPKYFCPFELKPSRFIDPGGSFMVNLYEDLYVKPSQQWKINLNLIDYNLMRLHTCMQLYTSITGQPALLSFTELPMALEYFLQIDADVFLMKTCQFRGAHPRLFKNKNNDYESEGIFCESKPIARYGTMPCGQESCFLCEPSHRINGKLFTSVHFSRNQVHHFVNKYRAFLNCDAHCDTSNIIYALTCPCGQCDFIGSTSWCFRRQILQHRIEGNRMVREFLIGAKNIDHILKQQKQSATPLANDNQMFLYQHSPRCTFALQRFLDKNPDYWCLVPMSIHEATMQDTIDSSNASTQSLPLSATQSKKPLFFAAALEDTTRSRQEAELLAEGVPIPPSGYRFSCRQMQEQIQFFQQKKETRVLQANLADLYDYAIVAVLQEDCSDQLRQFIEALFITHCETRLNMIGRLTQIYPSPLHDDSIRGDWCNNLVRPS